LDGTGGDFRVRGGLGWEEGWGFRWENVVFEKREKVEWSWRLLRLEDFVFRSGLFY
jgi:hypothetical protein